MRKFLGLAIGVSIVFSGSQTLAGTVNDVRSLAVLIADRLETGDPAVNVLNLTESEKSEILQTLKSYPVSNFEMSDVSAKWTCLTVEQGLKTKKQVIEEDIAGMIDFYFRRNVGFKTERSKVVAFRTAMINYTAAIGVNCPELLPDKPKP